MSRAVWFLAVAVMYVVVALGFVMFVWLVGDKVHRFEAAMKRRRDRADADRGWTDADDRKAAALLRDRT